MTWKNIAATGAVAGTLGLATLGLGAGIASADPGHGGPPCWPPYCQGDRHHDNGRDDHGGPGYYDPFRWDLRGIDDARFDHRPFNYQGQRVEPYFDDVRAVWGFWFLGVFIAL
jgi:hypothetical protein